MDEKEILETTGSDNLDGIYTLKVSGAALDAAIEQVENNKTNIETLQTSISTLNSSVNEAKTSITTINGQINTLNSTVGNEGSLTKVVTTLQGAVGDIGTRLTVVEASVSEENEFEGRVSTLEGKVGTLEGKAGAMEEDVYGVVNPETNAREGGIKDKLTSVIGRLDELKVDEEDAPIKLEQFYAGTTNTLTTITGVLNGTEEEPEGLVESVSNIKNRLNSFNDTTNTLEKEFEKVRLVIDETPWTSYTDEAIEPLADSIAALEEVIHDSENEQGEVQKGLTTRVIELEDNFKPEGYVKQNINRMQSEINSTKGSVITLTTRVQNLEDTKYNSTFSQEITIAKKEAGSSVPAVSNVSIPSSQGKHILGYKIYYYYVAQSNPTWSKVFIPVDLVDKFDSDTKLDSALGFLITKSFNLSDEFEQEREYFSIVDFHFSNLNTIAGYKIKIETLYEHNLSQSSSL